MHFSIVSDSPGSYITICPLNFDKILDLDFSFIKYLYLGKVINSHFSMVLSMISE